MRGLEYVIADQLQQLDAARDDVIENLDKLHSTDPQLLVDDVTNCCLRPLIVPDSTAVPPVDVHLPK